MRIGGFANSPIDRYLWRVDFFPTAGNKSLAVAHARIWSKVERDRWDVKSDGALRPGYDFLACVSQARTSQDHLRDKEVGGKNARSGDASFRRVVPVARDASNSKTKIKVNSRAAGWKWKPGRKVDKQKAIRPGANKY